MKITHHLLNMIIETTGLTEVISQIKKPESFKYTILLNSSSQLNQVQCLPTRDAVLFLPGLKGVLDPTPHERELSVLREKGGELMWWNWMIKQVVL